MLEPTSKTVVDQRHLGKCNDRAILQFHGDLKVNQGVQNGTLALSEFGEDCQRLGVSHPVHRLHVRPRGESEEAFAGHVRRLRTDKDHIVTRLKGGTMMVD